MKNEPLPERNGPASALSHLHFYHPSGPHGESHHLREDLDLLDEVPDELVVVCQGITLAGLQLFAKGYVTIVLTVPVTKIPGRIAVQLDCDSFNAICHSVLLPSWHKKNRAPHRCDVLVY